jgi:hypothetical protein
MKFNASGAADLRVVGDDVCIFRARLILSGESLVGSVACLGAVKGCGVATAARFGLTSFRLVDDAVIERGSKLAVEVISCLTRASGFFAEFFPVFDLSLF